jgi:hypothetical protein
MRKSIMNKSIMFGIAAVAAAGLVSMGCGSSDNQTSGSGGKQGSGGAGTGGAATGGSNGSGGKTGGGGSATGGTGGGSSATGGTSGGGGSTAASCGTTDGTESLNTTFETADSTKPFEVNKWGTWTGAEPLLEQTTSGPSGLDCSSGCAKLTVDYKAGTGQYSAGLAEQYFGAATTSTLNLLNETMTAKLALVVKKADGASKDVPIVISFTGEDTLVSTNNDNVWVYDLPGKAAALDAASGWHTVSYKIVDAQVPSWKPTRTVCASGLHDIAIRIQNTEAIDDSNAALVTLYIQSVSVGSGGSSGSGGAAGSSSGGAGGGGTTGSGGGSTGSNGGATGSSSGGSTGGGGDTGSSSGGSTGGGGNTGGGGDTGSPGGRTGGGRDGGAFTPRG